jgi:hypothetical protein
LETSWVRASSSITDAPALPFFPEKKRLHAWLANDVVSRTPTWACTKKKQRAVRH